MICTQIPTLALAAGYHIWGGPEKKRWISWMLSGAAPLWDAMCQWEIFRILEWDGTLVALPIGSMVLVY